jgi:nucleoside-diphosphate-sugar epimerase/uncharacterized membrane protein
MPQEANTEREVVIVTGSSGLIGAPTVRRLAPRLQVVGFDRAGNARPPQEAECVCVDVTSDESVQAGLARVRHAYGDRIASVIHLAAYYDFSGEPSPKYEQITVRGTERLLRELKHFHVEQFVFSSTMLVHKPSEPGQRITEDSPVEPAWDYPKSKVATEELLRANRGPIPIVLLRIAGVYDDQCHSIPIAHQIQRIYERQLESRVFPGDTARGRQAFVHLEDLLDSFERLIDRRQQLPPELVVLIGEPDAMSYEELQDEIGCEIHGKEWKTREIPAPLAKTGAWLEEKLPLGKDPFIKPWMIDLADDNYELDVTRARTVLGWEPKRSLRELLPKMIAALKKDPVRWYRENRLELPSSLKRSPAQEPARPEAPDEKHEHMTAEHSPAGTDRGHEAMHEGMHGANGMKPANMAGADQMKEPGIMMAEHHQMSLWVHPILMALGAWLMTSPMTFGYGGAMAWSDVVSGGLVILLAVLSLRPWGASASWANGFVGAWLVFAPLVFWAPSAAAYANDTLVGALVIAFSVLIPHGMPMEGPDVPRGWSYNPSSWLQRAPVIALGFIGFLGARYMAAFQLGHIETAWDPFFGDSTVRVLTSDVSRAWPISDAGLGATTYMFEALMGLMGDKRRWRTMPWMVTFFGILVIPLGVTSIVLVIMQPLAVGAWCTLCLATAVAMLVMIPLTVDEVVAMGQFLVQSHREGKPFWRTFWLGGNAPHAAEDARAKNFGSPPREMFPAMVWGVSLPPTLLVSAALGVWLMFAPSILGSSAGAADSDHLVGALVVTFAVIALAEVVRALRFINGLFGAWIIAAPWVLSGTTTGATWSDVITGVLLIALSLRRGEARERYGTWDRFIV